MKRDEAAMGARETDLSGVGGRVATLVLRSPDGSAGRGDRLLLSEMPVNIVYGTIPYAVMMATPCDLEDFAYGFSLTEGVVTSASDIRGVTCETQPDGLRLVVELAPNRMHAHLARRRSMVGRSSCGLCGIEDLEQVPRTPSRPPAETRYEFSAIRRALDALSDGQRLNRATGAAHAAACCGRDGDILALREDVGRHNALDKAIGAALRMRDAQRDGFLLVTSRCSFEMVEKAAAFGVGLLVAISAPTDLAVRRAVEHDLTLVALARADNCTVFTHPERLGLDPLS